MKTFLLKGTILSFAALVTFGLFMGMIGLISSEFEAQEKHEIASFEINPEIEEIQVLKRKTKIEELRKVQTPPPPPRIEQQQAEKPGERLIVPDGAIPDFTPPRLDRDRFVIKVSDRDAQPRIRVPPGMPDKADRSGHCFMRFNVSPQGSPYEIQAIKCSQSLFERNSIKAVQKWKYAPKIVDGNAVSMVGVETTIRFRLTDERGQLIPE